MDFDNSFDIITPDINTYITFGSTGGIVFPASTTANRPSAINGIIRYNTDLALIDVVINGVYHNLYTTPNLVDTTIVPAGTTQGGATATDADTVIATPTVAGSGLLLPTPTLGRQVLIKNNTSYFITIYPQSGDTIDGTTNKAITLYPFDTMQFIGTTPTAWIQFVTLFPVISNDYLNVTPIFYMDYTNSNTIGASSTFTRTNARYNYGNTLAQVLVGASQPRLFYNALTEENLGLVIEGAFGNYIDDSTDLRQLAEGGSAPNWGGGAGSILTTPTVTGVDYATTGYENTEGAVGLGSVIHTRTNTYTAAGAGEFLNAAINVKEVFGGRDYFIQKFSNTAFSSSNYGIVLQFSTNTLVNLTSVTAPQVSLIPAPNNYLRLNIAAVTQAAGTATFTIAGSTTTAQSGSTYTGDGRIMHYICNPQITFDTPQAMYLPTTTAAVTQSDEESCTYSVSNFRGQGTILVSCILPYTIKPSSTPICLTLSDGTTSNMVHIYFTESSFYHVPNAKVTVSGSATFTGTSSTQYAPPVITMTPIVMAIAFNTNDISFAVDGKIIATSTSAAVPTSFTTLHVGHGPAAGDRLYGIIQRVGVWNQRLPNAQLCAMTMGTT